MALELYSGSSTTEKNRERGRSLYRLKRESKRSRKRSAEADLSVCPLHWQMALKTFQSGLSTHGYGFVLSEL